MTGGISAVPPGRTGRLWLLRRLRTAHSGSALLDRKLHILHREQDRLRAEELRTRREWESSCATANLWLLRAALLSGRRSMELAASRVPADVTVHYELAAGTRYPSGVTCATPEQEGYDVPAIAVARRASREAVCAAARHAAAARAVRIIDTEAGATRYRLRAIDRRWIPRLERALAQIDQGLEEQEHADGVRIRQMTRHRCDPPAG